jgi:TonB-linked SusC/RagA family outer membrane protein
MKTNQQLKIVKIFTCLLIFSSLQSFALDKTDLNNETSSKLKNISVDHPMDRVSGRVTDNGGNPLTNVSVMLKGTNKGVTTDSTGEFTLQVNKGQTLIITSVGYATQEISFNGQSFIEVKLIPSATSLSDVVVVAFGTQKKVDLTGAVSQVKGEELVKRTTSNIQQALQGKVPGLTIQDYGASPGHTNMVMRIRGITSFGDNSPLVIVDGIEQTLDNINPQDIASVSVLKDAASTAIYGSRAANGVILITTKRAKSGKLSINYNGYYALQKSNNNPVHMGLRDYMDLQNIAWTNSYGNPIYTQEYIDEYVNATDRLKYPLPNIWYQTVLKVAPQISNYISLSGGNENVKTVLSARYQDQEGIIPNSNAKISEVRLNTDFKISDKINISTNINYRRSNILAPINEGKVFNDMLQTDQWTVPKYPDGTYGISSDGKNALMDAELNGTSKTLENYLTGNIEGNWEIIKGLKFTTQFGARTTATSGKNYQNKYEIRDYYDSTIVRLNVPHNSLTEIRNNVSEITLNSLLNYSNDWGGHNLNVLAGYSQIEDKTQTLTAYRQDFYSNEIQSIGQGANDATKNNSGGESTWGLRSYFGRINYNYENKYLFEANSRYDGSSRFMDKNRYSFSLLFQRVGVSLRKNFGAKYPMQSMN